MLTQKEIKDKLYEYAGVFRHHIRRKEYPQARYCYDTAVNVALFVALEQDEKNKLFGIRGEKGEIIQQGEFAEAAVILCYEKTALGKTPKQAP